MLKANQKYRDLKSDVSLADHPSNFAPDILMMSAAIGIKRRQIG
jgi:hypothetical protein